MGILLIAFSVYLPQLDYIYCIFNILLCVVIFKFPLFNHIIIQKNYPCWLIFIGDIFCKAQCSKELLNIYSSPQLYTQVD